MGKERDNNISRGDVGAYVFFEYDNELVVAGGVGAVCAEWEHYEQDPCVGVG